LLEKNYMGYKTIMGKLSTLKTGVFVVTLFVTQFAFAQPAGTVTFKIGEVSITHNDKTITQAAKNDPLNAGDTIETKDGRLQLALIDGGKVSLQPNTIYRINKYEFSGKEDGSEYGFTELIKGGLRTISGLIGHKNRDRYQLKTAVATIGIRGTEFTVNFNDNQFLMTTNHGSVDVCNAGGCLNAATGQSIEVAGLGAAPKPSNKTAKAAAASVPAAEKKNAAANDSKDSESSSDSHSSAASNSRSHTDTSEATNSGLNSGSHSEHSSGSDNPSISPSDKITSDGTPDAITKSLVSSPGKIKLDNYFTGPVPNTGVLATLSGTINYSVQNSTNPFLVVGNSATSIGKHNQVNGNMNVNFSANNFTYSLSVPTNVNGTFNLTGGGSFSGETFNTGSTVTNTTACGTISNCSGNINGSLLGVNANSVGLIYGIDVPNLNGSVSGGVKLK